MWEGSLFSTPSAAFIVCWCFDYSLSDQCEVIPHCNFDFRFSNWYSAADFWCWWRRSHSQGEPSSTLEQAALRGKSQLCHTDWRTGFNYRQSCPWGSFSEVGRDIGVPVMLPPELYCDDILIAIHFPIPYTSTERNLANMSTNGEQSMMPFYPQLCSLSAFLPLLGFPCGSAGKEAACNAGDLGSIPGLGRPPGKGKGYPLQYSGLENSMDCIAYGVAKCRTQLSDFHFTFPFYLISF